jgi:glycosyltransferase involved in cell wall biosynthesis
VVKGGDILRDMKGLVAIPVHNEAANLAQVVEVLTEHVPRGSILFINDGSTDESASILAASGLPYVNHPVNLGYLEALKTGILSALRRGHDYVVFFDADGQHRIEDLKRIVQVHEAEGYDLIVGSRYKGGRERSMSARSIGTRAFSLITTVFAGTTITDVTCGLKLISRPFMPLSLELPAEDMHAEFIVGMARCGARVHEEPITVEARTGGDSMYSFKRALFYPAKTVIALIAGMAFSRGVRRPHDPRVGGAPDHSVAPDEAGA